MRTQAKIILTISGLLVGGVTAFIAFGLYSLEIEDTYGDNQDIFYNSRQGYLVVNHSTKEFGEIRKTWTKFYVIKGADTVDIKEWWGDKQIEVYRPVNSKLFDKNLSYLDIEKLIKGNKIELIKKVR